MESHGTLRTWPPGARTRVSLASAACLATTPPKRRNLPGPRKNTPHVSRNFELITRQTAAVHGMPLAALFRPRVAPLPPQLRQFAQHAQPSARLATAAINTGLPRAHGPASTVEAQCCTRIGQVGALVRLTRISPGTRRAAVLLPPSRGPARRLSIEQSASRVRPAVREISPFYCAPTYIVLCGVPTGPQTTQQCHPHKYSKRDPAKEAQHNRLR